MAKFDSKIITHIKKDNLEYLQFNILNKYKVRHCITLKRGGVSTGCYESLNFRTLGKDKIENVLKNLEIIKNDVGFTNVCKGRQDHTDRVIEINSQNKDTYLFENLCEDKVDGYITDDDNIATLITTADCNPIIIYDKENNAVANVHAGWKGVINKIYLNAIKMMQEKYDSKLQNLIVCIGPSIRKECFSSKEESFKEQFTSVFNYSSEYLEYENDNETFHIDLISILKHELKEYGVLEENIYVADICTRCNTEDFYSYRYSRQSKQEDYATMATIVQLGKND